MSIVYGEGQRVRTLAEAVLGAKAAVGDDFQRYRRTLYPLTHDSKLTIGIASQLVRRWGNGTNLEYSAER